MSTRVVAIILVIGLNYQSKARQGIVVGSNQPTGGTGSTHLYLFPHVFCYILILKKKKNGLSLST